MHNAVVALLVKVSLAKYLHIITPLPPFFGGKYTYRNHAITSQRSHGAQNQKSQILTHQTKGHSLCFMAEEEEQQEVKKLLQNCLGQETEANLTSMVNPRQT